MLLVACDGDRSLLTPFSKAVTLSDGRLLLLPITTQVYGLPFNMTRRWQRAVGTPAKQAFISRVLKPTSGCWRPIAGACMALLTCWGTCGPQPDEDEDEASRVATASQTAAEEGGVAVSVTPKASLEMADGPHTDRVYMRM